MFTVQGVLKIKVLQRQIPISSFKFFVKDNFIRWMDDKSLFRQGAICDVNLKKTLHPKLVLAYAFALSKAKNSSEHQRILLLSKKNLKIVLDFNLVL